MVTILMEQFDHSLHWLPLSHNFLRHHQVVRMHLIKLYINPCHAEYILIFSQSDFLIKVVDTNSHNGKQCRSRSVGFKSRLICIYTVCKASAGQGLTFTSLGYITKTCLYNIDPLKPHFYIVKLGFGVYWGIHYFSYFCSKTQIVGTR